MMSVNDNYNDDDYVAKLLAEDAKRSSMKYASAGLSALLPKRPSGSAPKPNTRFLRNLVRETDMHNAALKKKEELEAHNRLRAIQKKEDKGGDESKHYRDRKRRRLSDDDDDDAADTQREGRRSRIERRKRDSVNSEEAEQRGSRHHQRSRKYKDISSSEAEERHMNSSSLRRRRSERDIPIVPSDRGVPRSRKYSHEDRSSEPTRRSSKQRERGSEPRSYRSDEVNISSRNSSGKLSRHRRSPSQSSFSDTLEDLVGPLPPKTRLSPKVNVRGRGAHRVLNSSSNINDHFSSNYDPANDVDLNSDEDSRERDDWDMALEALRDRSMWKRKQADRMRDAGWKDEEIAKWERSAPDKFNGQEGDLSQVKWASKGESREWDKGKTIEL